jgi:hypothetical protein
MQGKSVGEVAIIELLSQILEELKKANKYARRAAKGRSESESSPVEPPEVA